MRTPTITVLLSTIIMLRDRLVVGINNDYIQRRLLAEGDMSFQRTLELALGLEAAVINTRAIQSASILSEESTVNQLSSKKMSAESSPCYRRGGTGHTPVKCKFKEARCYNCETIGHIAKVCCSKSQNQSARPVKQISTVSPKMLHDVHDAV